MASAGSGQAALRDTLSRKDADMPHSGLKSPLTRRDFLRLALVSGGSLVLSPLLKACGGVTGQVPGSGTPPSAHLSATATPPGPLDGLAGLDIDAFFEQAYRRWLVRDPENLTVLGLADSFGVGDANLTDISDAYLRETQALEVGTLEQLHAYPIA